MSRYTPSVAVFVALLAAWPAMAQGPRFEMCSRGNQTTCVVDGDSFHWHGDRVRIENIDAPELDHAQCESERVLAQAAADRLIELLNGGGWRLVQMGSRDADQYGRKLRVVMMGDTDAGSVLIGEHRARVWTGRREPWCGGS